MLDTAHRPAAAWLSRQGDRLRSRRGFALQLIAFLALQLADCATTAAALATGNARERNPFGAELLATTGVGAYAIKFGLCCAIAVILWHYEWRPWSRAITAIVLPWTAWTVLANLHWLLTQQS